MKWEQYARITKRTTIVTIRWVDDSGISWWRNLTRCRVSCYFYGNYTFFRLGNLRQLQSCWGYRHTTLLILSMIYLSGFHLGYVKTKDPFQVSESRIKWKGISKSRSHVRCPWGCGQMNSGWGNLSLKLRRMLTFGFTTKLYCSSHVQPTIYSRERQISLLSHPRK